MELAEDVIPERPPADAALTVCDYESGFSLRYCEGPRSSLVWQAGVLATEYRNYRGSGMVEPFIGTVSLFHLRGYGSCREDAVRMAVKNGRANVTRI